MFKREETRKVKVGNLIIGGGSPVRVQAMCQTKTKNVKETVNQIKKLEKLGCELVRVAVPDMESAKCLGAIKKEINIPLVADIHFQPFFALESINQGVDKIRINPANIGSEEKIKMVVRACQKKNIPIRIGINMGSLEKDLYQKYGRLGIAYVMVESATRQIKLLEKLKFFDIIVSLKSSDVNITRQANTLFAKRFNYPLHIGVTEAGPSLTGVVKSAVGIGSILSEGIGDTIRVSTSGSPYEQVKIGWQVLTSLNLRQRGVEIISCPTCGRTEINLISLAKKIKKLVSKVNAPIKIAVMGCIVNGPGEANFADIGFCGGRKTAAIFRKGKLLRIVDEDKALPLFIEEIKKILKEKGYEKEILRINDRNFKV